jgi:hypothetical protein
MTDAIFITITGLFYVAAIAYVLACERLEKKP